MNSRSFRQSQVGSGLSAGTQPDYCDPFLFPGLRPHRSFSVAKPTIAQRIPRIQNRTTICSFLQPSIWKW